MTIFRRSAHPDACPLTPSIWGRLVLRERLDEPSVGKVLLDPPVRKRRRPEPDTVSPNSAEETTDDPVEPEDAPKVIVTVRFIPLGCLGPEEEVYDITKFVSGIRLKAAGPGIGHRVRAWLLEPEGLTYAEIVQRVRAEFPDAKPIDWTLYKERNLVERFFNQIKRFRRIALRCEDEHYDGSKGQPREPRDKQGCFGFAIAGNLEQRDQGSCQAAAAVCATRVGMVTQRGPAVTT